MKNTFPLYTLLVLLFIGILAACSSNKSAEKALDLSSLKFTVNDFAIADAPGKQTVVIDNEKPNHIKTIDGTKILIPKEAFVDANGTPIKGKVTLDYTSYNNPSEIITSGIPMQCVDNGEIKSFVSDGMFKIEAKSETGAVQIASGKELQVYQPSKDQNNDFNLWYFDEAKGSWIDKGKRQENCTEENIEKKANEINVPKTENCETKSDDKEIFVMPEIQIAEQNKKNKKSETQLVRNSNQTLELNKNKSILDINFNKNTYPELAEYSRIMWQFSGTDPKQDPDNNPWINDNEWKDVKLNKISDLQYELSFQTGSKSFKTIVSPALTGSDLEKAKEKFANLLQKADNKQKEITKEIQTQFANNIVYNSFTANKLGMYNCDRFYSDRKAEEFEPTCLFEGDELPKNQTYFIITDNKTGVIQFSPAYYKMRMRAEQINGIISIAAGGILTAVSKNNVEKMRHQKGGRIKLIFEKIGRVTQGGVQEFIDNM